MTWELATFDRQCGACGAAIARGTPVLLVASANLPRCHACAKAIFGTEPPVDLTPLQTPVPPAEQPFATPRGWAGRARRQFDARMRQAGEKEIA